eukprot:gnl/Chilomastix_caulleri/1922.p2 GENE.gnl/Chilomastix_caulleri/1922~~gnl/Chilomastix_caulleri/1922.p2  ORF type:complete len:55 (+),score=2.30 gnl/Chilomastix_caulleri/1922:325-489(+)
MLHESGMMTDREYKIYCDLFANMSNFMRRSKFHCTFGCNSRRITPAHTTKGKRV